MPSTLSFNSELNNQWYRTNGVNANNTSISKQEIKPGESIETTLTLTRTLDETIQTYTNTARIGATYNAKHIADKNIENDSDKVEVIVSVQTGTVTEYVGTVMIAVLTICIMLAIAIIIMKKSVNNKGIKMFLLLIIMIIGIGNINLVKVSEAVDEAWFMNNPSFNRVNIKMIAFGVKIFADEDGRVYSCTSPNKAQCSQGDHWYVLKRATPLTNQVISVGSLGEGASDLDISAAVNNSEEGGNGLTQLSGYRTTWAETNEIIQGTTKKYGPFKLKKINGDYSDEIPNIIGFLDEVYANVQLADGSLLDVGFHIEEDTKQIRLVKGYADNYTAWEESTCDSTYTTQRLSYVKNNILKYISSITINRSYTHRNNT